jgi:DNA-binding CsgD family transcriptional regulator
MRVLVAAGAVAAAALAGGGTVALHTASAAPSPLAALTGALARTSADSYTFSLDTTVHFALRTLDSDVVSGAFDPTRDHGTELLTARSAGQDFSSARKMPPTAATNLPVSLSAKFTQREMSILRLIAFGFTNVQIGEMLHISKYTVAQHIAKMLRRLGAANRTGLVNRAHVEGILQSHVTE